jgi:hypothetical protein
MSRNVLISSPALGHTQNQFNKRLMLDVSETRVDFLEKGLIVVYSVWLHRCRDFSVPTPSVDRAQHRI